MKDFESMEVKDDDAAKENEIQSLGGKLTEKKDQVLIKLDANMNPEFWSKTSATFAGRKVIV